ncbi:MAG: hypothetical protein RLZZ320_297 [Actinomycetota bacterium]|jgi:hypothetical protein
MKQKIKNDKSLNQLRSIAQFKVNFNLRLAFGILLICTSFVSAYLLSSSTNRMVTVWSATKDLAPGSLIKDEDIKQTQVLMPNNAQFYLDGMNSILGSYVIRPIGAEELIPAYAVTTEPISDLREVPISIPINRLPYQIKTGQIVDVYAVPKQQTALIQESLKSKAALLLSSVGISGIDSESGKLGGEIAVTLLVPVQLVNELVSAIAKYDFVLVKTL